MHAYSHLSDTDLADLLRSGDAAAFDQIYHKHWSGLYDKAYRRCRDREMCLDILQTVFTDLWLRREKVDIGNLPAYLHTAVRFQYYKQLEKRPKGSVYLDYFDEVLASPISADDALRENELLAVFEHWLSALPKKRREIFLLHYSEELSTRQIAEKLGLSQKTVQSQLYVASQNLRDHIGQYLILAAFIDHLGRH